MRANTAGPRWPELPSFQTSTSELIDTGAHGAALARLLPDLRAGHRDPQLIDQAATCYSELGETDLALEMMEEFVTRWPDVISGWTRLATLAAHKGDSVRAIHALRQGFRRGPKTAQGLALLNRLSPIPFHSTAVRRLKDLSDRANNPATDRAIAMHTLGVINDRAGRYRNAFRWFAQANRAVGGRYDPREVTAMVAGQLLRFDPDLRIDGPADLPRFVFVTGMPRSGTTLVERILQRHPQVQSLGESPALSRTVMALRRHMSDRGKPASAWDWCGALNAGEMARFQTYFLSFLPADLRSSGKVLVTKMPLDCFDLGVAHMLVPQARFVFVDRHPLDVGLSNFCTQFHKGHGFSTRLDWTGHMIRSVHRSAGDYEDKLGSAFRRQSYRALMERPEPQIRAVLSHLDLPWDPACLSPELSPATTLTASSQQVQAGINRDGLDRWQNYRDYLDPLVEALGGSDWIAGWNGRDAAA